MGARWIPAGPAPARSRGRSAPIGVERPFRARPTTTRANGPLLIARSIRKQPTPGRVGQREPSPLGGPGQPTGVAVHEADELPGRVLGGHGDRLVARNLPTVGPA